MSQEKEPMQANALAIDCSTTADPELCEQQKRTSKSLKELSESDANQLVVTCDEKYRLENGDCEIPNQPQPKKLIEKDEKKQKHKI